MSPISRRNLLKATAIGAAATQIPWSGRAGAAQPTASAGVHWLEGVPDETVGVTWGVPWPQGVLSKDQAFALHTADGTAVPVQNWPIGYWPDGSLKWTAHAIGPTAPRADSYLLQPGTPETSSTTVTTRSDGNGVTIDTGTIRCRINRHGSNLVDSIIRGGRKTAQNGALVCLRRSSADDPAIPVETFVSEIRDVTVEQSGPVRAVVRIDGVHRHNRRGWLPFTVRLYFYAGGEAIRMVHSFVFDGDQKNDFISGLGIRFTVPMSDEPWNRHIRLAGQDRGIFGEAVQGITGLRRDPGAPVRAAQIAGEPTPPLSTWDTRVSGALQYVPTWAEYSLRQLTADGFQIRKRTKPGQAWISAASGNRATGLGYVGGVSGGLAIGLRNFWQLHPTQLDIHGATGDSAEITVWLWSPDATPMDLRTFHDTMGMDTFAEQTAGLNITYEDYEPGWDTPHGIARTNELVMWALSATPAAQQFSAFAAALQTPPLLAASPEYLHSTGVFGNWAPADTSTPAKAEIEDHLDFLFTFHRGEVERRGWYGFWDYGDIMHTYDADRHVWRYDVGGYAWDNSELSSEMWLWYYYLHTGRADAFRFAEAMTRHTGEVDVYHVGKYHMLGTRHGVLHFADSAKQLRISTAAYRRFYYFLTADERVGDLMHDLIDAAETFLVVDPIRKIRTAPYKPTRHALDIGFGTDWSALAAAWLTEWERGGNPVAQKRLAASMQTIAAQKNGFVQGSALYDLDTGKYAVADPPVVNVSDLSAVFGLVEMCSELISLMDIPEFAAAWQDYCYYYNASHDEQQARYGASFGSQGLAQAHSRLTAYVAAHRNDAALAARAWKEFYTGKDGYGPTVDWKTTNVEPPNVLNPVVETDFASTNASSQYGLAAIQCLALIGDEIPS